MSPTQLHAMLAPLLLVSSVLMRLMNSNEIEW